ncbi:MAG: LPP20 family lipoprotein [Thiovulaceae bacterium]|nr:LPP20 family lipoprotein [Sulfurimonadaceae bacterium]
MKLSFLFVIVLLLLSGCSKPPTVEVAPKPQPAWMTNPPLDASSLYGVGEGKDKENALANGLNSIASTLSVSVKSKLTTNTRVHSDNGVENYTRDDEQKVDLFVKEIRLSSYEILESEKLGFESYGVLVKADKSALFKSLKDEADKMIALLKNDESTSKAANILEQFYFYENATYTSDNLLYKSLVLKVLKPSFDDGYIIAEIKSINESFNRLKSSMTFSVTADKESQNFIDPFKSILSDRGFQIAQKEDKYHLHVNITSHTIFTHAYGFDLARSAINIDIRDSKNQIVKSKKVDIIGQSSQGEDVAKQDIAIKFKESVLDIL